MLGVLKGRFLGININLFEGVKYYKALFLTTDDNGKLNVEYVSISNEHLEEISSLAFGADVQITLTHSRYNGVDKWKY